MLQDYTKTAGSFGQLVEDTLLQEYEALCCVRFPRLQHYNGSTRLVVSGVEPVPQVERGVRVGFVLGLIVKVVNWHREVVRRVQESWVRVSLAEHALADCVPLFTRVTPQYAPS